MVGRTHLKHLVWIFWTQGVADFLQEVTSRKDQAQYWHSDKPYRFVSVSEFAEAFQHTQAAEHTRQVVSMPFDRAASPKGALVRAVHLSLYHMLVVKVAQHHGSDQAAAS